MNSSQSPTSPTQKAQQFIRSNLVSVIIASASLNAILTGAATWNIWQTFQSLQVTTARHDQLEKLSSKVIYFDEVLTMSANMLVSTGQPQWEKRYRDYTLLANPLFQEFLQNIPPAERNLKQIIHNSAEQLFKMEKQALQLVQEQKRTEAAAILLDDQYNQQKKIYIDNIKTVINSIENNADRQVLNARRGLELSIILEILSLVLSAINGLIVITAVRSYMADRQSTQEALQISQENLLITNNALEREVQQRQKQEELIQKENVQFQQDVSELLGIVNEIEAGDLTIQAEVNDRATGLVNDTINRLIESLGNILHQVGMAARRVEANSCSQKDITAIVNGNIDRQTKSMSKALRLTRAVRQSAKNAVKQLLNTNQSLIDLQAAVADGQSTILTLDQDIDSLQLGSDRIVQEIKTLSEFVGLTDQFVQDQGEIVTQTQILALNAALVAARAAEQRDPQQFAMVAREFELIASQVSQLAQETNEGLTSLEQRSSQINRVVSAVNIDVQQLGGLVNSFTQGVKDTRSVFSKVQLVTTQAVQSGKTVSITSQKIVGAADLTVTDIESIANLAQEILQQSQGTQQLGDQLAVLSQDLLNNVRFFKLPEVARSSTPAASLARTTLAQVPS
jgi:methyl-accepting chemotaxis protein PixJ